MPRRRDAAEIEVAAGVTLAQLNDAVARTRGAGLKLIEIAGRIPDPKLAPSIAAIGRTLMAIAECFEQEPADIRRAYDFLDYHLRRGYETVAVYARLAGAPEITPRERLLLAAATMWNVPTSELTAKNTTVVSEAAAHLSRAQSVVSEIVDGLEDKGLLARMRDSRDRRRTLVWLTDAGG